MLLCVDGDKNIRVYRIVRDSEGQTSRERIGIVAKKDLAIGDAFESLPQEELDELKDVVELYKEAKKVRARSDALAFPETMRQVTDFFEQHATPSERKLIFTAVMEGLRHLRRVSKDQ